MEADISCMMWVRYIFARYFKKDFPNLLYNEMNMQLFVKSCYIKTQASCDCPFETLKHPSVKRS